MSQPQENPLRQMYEEWSGRTPFVSRNTMIAIIVIYILSFFFSADMALGNMPFFSILHFEIYRIILSPGTY
jgi:hypothetical protein